MIKVYEADLELLDDDDGGLAGQAGFVGVKVSPDGFVCLDYEPQPGRCTATFRLDLDQRRCWVTVFDPKVERLRYQMKRKGRPGWRSIDVTDPRHFREGPGLG